MGYILNIFKTMKEFNFNGITIKLFVGRNVLKIVTISTVNNFRMTANYILDSENCLLDIGEYLTTYLMPHIGYGNTDKLYKECFETHQDRKLKRTLKVLEIYSKLSERNLPKAFFLQLHNYLIAENKFQSVVNENKKQILINLFVSYTTDIEEIYKIFEKLYCNINSVVRYHAETLDSITEVREYIKSKDTPKYNKFYRTFLNLRNELK